MNPNDCKKNAIAHFPAFKFKDGNVKPKFFILMDDIDKETDKAIIATFTSNLRFKNESFCIFVPKNYFKDFMNDPFPYEDSLLDCNTCCEIPAKIIRSGNCKLIGHVKDGWMSKVYKALEYATKIEPVIVLKLKGRLNLK